MNILNPKNTHAARAEMERLNRDLLANYTKEGAGLYLSAARAYRTQRAIQLKRLLHFYVALSFIAIITNIINTGVGGEPSTILWIASCVTVLGVLYSGYKLWRNATHDEFVDTIGAQETVVDAHELHNNRQRNT